MKYPKGTVNICNNTKNNTVFSNRGMSLEKDINSTNKYYSDNSIAFIYKKPTPIKILEFDRKTVTIKKAVFEAPSTTDYNGLYRGRYIDFEAKETDSKEGFPLINIHKHQINHIRNIVKCGGIAFLIIRLNSYSKTFVLEGNVFIDYIDNNLCKYVPVELFNNKGHEIMEKYAPRLDYLKIIDKIYGGILDE
ncbi:MAG: Holliday junction resolvase RecU [Bacilli bacterium]|nr:Holliday junction resolvase RecU [Bacilli bacterium]